MKSEIEAKLLREIDQLKRKIDLLEGKDSKSVPTYRYSKIRDADLKNLFDIEMNLDDTIFDNWFNNALEIDEETEAFLEALLDDNKRLIEIYSEEDLKVNFIAPILNRIRFKSFEKKIRDFYELQMVYKTSEFILAGTVDYVVSKGLTDSKTPYFFIQEFKRSEEYGNPRPQLVAELISAVELNDWKFIKGAYIIGGSWHFVILERITVHQYQYFISQNFDSTKISDLRLIYKNLLFVKNEILTKE